MEVLKRIPQERICSLIQSAVDEGAELMIDGREVGRHIFLKYVGLFRIYWTNIPTYFGWPADWLKPGSPDKVENETCEDSLLPIGSDSYLLTYYVSLLTLKDLRRAILNLKHLKILLEGDGA